MEREAQWAAVETERRSLADLLDALEPEQWEHPSLCTEWRVRDVAAHVAMTPRPPSLASIVAGVARARGDVWAYGRDIAVAHAQRPTSQIVEELRRDAAARAKPAVTTLENVLLDVVVHGQDIAVPLGIPRAVPRDAGIAAFERAWSMGWPFHARKRLAGVRLVATDADVAVGEGTPVEGPASVLLLLTTGRTTAALAQLRGPGVELVREQALWEMRVAAACQTSHRDRLAYRRGSCPGGLLDEPDSRPRRPAYDGSYRAVGVPRRQGRTR